MKKELKSPLKRNLTVMALIMASIFILGACGRQSGRVSHNVSREADEFNVVRRVAVLNMRSDEIVFEVIGFSSLVLWLVPEFVYLQDGYGIDNARMNTIFKIYSANWAISYLFAFYLLSNVISKCQLKNYKILDYIIPCVIISSLCFFKLKEFRKFEYESTLKERSEGLTKVNAQFNGAKDTISKLRGLKKGVMLESTKGAYNYASHVATLSGNTSYLGWINHVQLLYKNYQDVQKRKQEIDDFYTKLSCNDRRTFLREKDILYVVLGPLEREEYGNTLNNDFYCLKNIIQYGRYNIFTLE